MNDEIRSLVDSLRRGQYENPSEKIRLLVAALREEPADTTTLTSLLSAPQITLRLAGIEACMGRDEVPLMRQALRLAEDREECVRAKAAETLGSFPEEISSDALRALCLDPEEEVRIAALKATAGRRSFHDLHCSLLAEDASWGARLAAAQCLGQHKDSRVVPALFAALAHDSDSDVQRCCAELIEKRLGHSADETQERLPTEIALLKQAERHLQGFDGPFPKLRAWIQSHTTMAVDPQALSRFGTDLTAQAAVGSLPRAYCAADACQSVLRLIHRDPCKSIVLLGDSGVGKSALVNELVYELAKPEQGGWHVLRVSPTDFMAGTKYSGEWETKVRDLIEVVRRPRKVLVYIPNFSDLVAMGRWEKSDANVASALAPYLEEGSLLLLGENTPEEFERGLGAIPSLQRLFDKILISEASPEETLDVLRGIRDENKAVVSDELLERLREASDFYLGHLRRPGNAATLLRSVLGSRRDPNSEITFQDILDSLSQSSGVPAKMLDDQTPLDLEAVRGFFEQRIMGQAAAVNAVLDLITLIKAGLTDPHKPFGVFLFVGPTGVGKTELARALAEFIFGDPKRLFRFDMSEYSSVDSFQRLIGARGENGLLTDAIRQQPFSVVLLDEIEKSHINVFDLCLQIFDAGRLTDGRGRLVDFRRSIVILTSNIGAQLPAPTMGFSVPGQPPAPEDGSERTWRELTRFFRPEFLNRIDRIVHFDALSIDVAERIARREVELVLQRDGVARRGLKVHVAPSVISWLVREGYSPHFGARPLKRTVEQHLLLPLARAIAGGHVPDDTVFTVETADRRITVHATRPQVPPALSPKPAPASRARLASQCGQLCARLQSLDLRVRPLQDRKSELLTQTHEPGFYQDSTRRSSTFDEIRKLDQYLELVAGLRRSTESIGSRLAEKFLEPPNEHEIAERLETLALDIADAESIATARQAVDLADSLLVIELVNREGEPICGVEQLASLYQNFAARHRLAAECLAERCEGRIDQVCLHISGLGAYALLKLDAGLHKMDRRTRSRTVRQGRQKSGKDSELVRVEVFPMEGEPDKKFVSSVTSTVRELKPRKGRLIPQVCWQIRLFHPPSLRALETWAGGSRAEALARAMQVLHAQVASGRAAPAAKLVRNYVFGVGSRIKRKFLFPGLVILPVTCSF